MSEQKPVEERLFHVGIDMEWLPKMLVGAHALARCFDVNVATIRRWARTGVMPAPRSIRGRRLWSADELRVWIRRGCPDLSESSADRS